MEATEKNTLTVVEYDADGVKIKLDPETVKNYLVRGNGAVTDQEVLFFIQTCRAQKLNPLAYGIYCNTDPDTTRMSCGVLRDQYAGETGYNPGSQMVQIAGIALLDPVDHYAKEQLHVKYYTRYMDDFWMLLPTKEQAEKTYTETVEKIQAYGLEINEKKSHVVPLRKGFTFLGFRYRMTDTGKVIMTLNPDSVKHERKTLARMVNKSKRGELPPEKVEEHHNAWQNNAEKGNSNKVRERTRKYLKQLKGDEKNESKKNDPDTRRGGRGRKSQGNSRKAETDHRKPENNDSVLSSNE